MNQFLELLEHMSNIGVLVISRDCFAILYCNSTFLTAYPDAETGMLCEQLFAAHDEVSPLKEFLGVEQELFSMSKGKLRAFLKEFCGDVDIQIAEVMWENETPAFLLTIVADVRSQEERYQELIGRALSNAMVRVYPFVMVVNLTANRFQITESAEDYDFEQGERGYFTEAGEFLLSKVHPDYREECSRIINRDEILESYTRGDTERHMEFLMLRHDGEYHWMAIRMIRIYAEDRHRVSCIALMRDVNYRKDKQDRLQATLDATYSAIPGGIMEFVIDDDLTVLFMNQAFCELMDKTPEDYARGYKEHILEQDRARVLETIYGAAKDRAPFDVVYRVKKGKNGEVVWVHSRGVKVDERNDIPVYLAIRLDVTEMKNAEIALMEERARADLAMGTTDALRFEYDSREDLLTLFIPNADSGRGMRARRYERYTELLRERGDAHRDDIKKLLSVFREGNRRTIEVRFRQTGRKQYEWHRVKSADVSDSAGRNYIVGIIENIAKVKQLESTNRNLLDQLGFVVSDTFERLYLIDIPDDSCRIMFMNTRGRKKDAVLVNFTRMAAVIRRTRIYPADRVVFDTKYHYLTEASLYEKGRSEIYFDIRIRDGFGPEYHWYSILIKQLDEKTQRFLCLIKNIDETKKQEDVVRQAEEQQKYQRFSEQIIDSLGTLVEFRDTDSGQHIRRTRQLTRILLTYLAKNVPGYHLSEDAIAKITTASSMHDVGKISIPDAILNKPGRLTTEEFEIMKTHTTKGYEILLSLNLGQDEEFSKYCREICRYHHERYDGNGYPDQLSGDEIPIWGQIVSVVDVYDALVSPRVYKSAYSHETAMEMIMGGECGCFNPDLLAAIRDCAEQLRACYD